MRRRAGTLAALGAALCGALPVLVEANVVLFSLTVASIAVLWLSAAILVLHDRNSSRVWRRLVTIAEGIAVEYAAIGLGLVSTGLAMFQSGVPDLSAWMWLGIVMMLLGALLIGGQIGKGIGIMIEQRSGS